MHYYQFNIGDYHAHTSHLDPLEDAAYRRMIDYCYLNEIPLPNNIDEIARLIRMRSHTECIAIVLREFFTLTDDGYIQPRIDADLAKYHEKSAKAKNSANARWKKEASKDKGLGDANALRTESEGNANHKPLTTNHKPITKENKTLDQSEIDPEVMEFCFDQFWKSGIRKVNKKKSKPLFNKVLKEYATGGGPTAYDFTTAIVNDIQKRLNSNQLGFAEMHPTTYLNGERWNDEVITNDQTRLGQNHKLSAVERVKQAGEANRAARANNSHDMDGIGGVVWRESGEPVRGNDAESVGRCLEGSYTKTDS